MLKKKEAEIQLLLAISSSVLVMVKILLWENKMREN